MPVTETKPTSAEMDAAVRLLERADREVCVILCSDTDKHVWLTAFSHTAESAKEQREEAERLDCQEGTVEYQVCDGPPGNRSHSYDFYDFYEALACYNGVREKGWKRYGKS